ncbi:MAG: extracellular solute-binding protein, partial [Candidatus Omnitrophica bacterium]|nr:extracellular solute-binding protein [Candidatus Omnitrophota bacterium]
MRRPLKILITLGALALIPIMVERTGEKVKAYPGASSAHAELERGLDFLMTGKNIPMDFLSAIEKFSQVAPEHGATSLEAEIAEFLSAWCIWADPSSDNKRKEMALSDFQLKYPDSPFLAHALFMRALIESTSIPQTGPDTAISTYKKIVQDYPDSTLADLSRLALAGLHREQVHDLRESARWYGEVVRSGTDTFLLHEIELFHYLQAKMLQEAGDADEARRIYHAILESEKKSAGNWKDRALDRLAELGEKVQDESWGEVQQTSFPMQNHSFSSDKPITLRISSWILEKKGMLEAFTQIGEKYHEHNPDVTIEWISLPYTGYHDWLQTQILSDEIPDIVQIDNGTAVRYGAYQGKLVDISPYLEKPNNYTGVRWAEMFWPQFLIEARDPVKRRNWVVSWASENSAFIYNKDAFRKAGLIKRDNSGNAVRDSSGKEVVDEPETWADL